MRPVSLRWLLGVAAVLAFVLTACSSPATPQPAQPENHVVSIDGYQAQIDTSKLDLAPLSFWHAPETTYCDSNVKYAQVTVPMIGRDATGKLTTYVDVFWMPRSWNHKLALYAHGYVAPGDPSFIDQITNPTPATQPLLETRDRLLCEGYALGASSFSADGYAVQQGIIDTHLMNAVFPFIFWRRPSDTYVFGSSMGGLITVALAELFPNRYDGAMPTCGPIGGSLAEFSYIGNVRLLFDEAYPPQSVDPVYGVLKGSLTSWVADDTDPNSPTYWMKRVVAAIQADGVPFAALNNTSLTYSLPSLGSLTLPLLQTPLNYKLLYGIPGDSPLYHDPVASALAGNALLHALRYHVEGAGDVLARGGGSPFSTLPTGAYGAIVPTNPPGFLSPTTTYTASDSALAYYSFFYQPSGNLQIPMLSLHGWVDPDVPTAHELVYQALVSAHSPDPSDFRAFLVMGTMPLDLLQMAGDLGIDPSTLPSMLPYGHCNFLPTDMVAGLTALDERATTGNWAGLADLGSDFTPLSVALP